MLKIFLITSLLLLGIVACGGNILQATPTGVEHEDNTPATFSTPTKSPLNTIIPTISIQKTIISPPTKAPDTVSVLIPPTVTVSEEFENEARLLIVKFFYTNNTLTPQELFITVRAFSEVTGFTTVYNLQCSRVIEVGDTCQIIWRFIKIAKISFTAKELPGYWKEKERVAIIDYGSGDEEITATEGIEKPYFPPPKK